MEGTARTWFTPKEKADLWERWRSGQCVADIARALERRNKSGVYRILALNGGIAPAQRRRALIALRLDEREEISRGIAAGQSMRQIAQSLRRSPSTISREIRRNGGCSAYRASEAEMRAWERALRPKPCRLARHAGFDEDEERSVLGPRVAARTACRSGAPWDGARPMADARDLGRADRGALPRQNPSDQHRLDAARNGTSFQT